MRRVIPVGRFITGLLLGGGIALGLIWVGREGTAFRWGHEPADIVLLALCASGIFYSLHLMASHVAYDDEKLIVRTLLGRTVIRYETVRGIVRRWEGSAKGTRLRWYVRYWDARQERERSGRLYFPESPENKSVREFLSALTAANADATLSNELRE